MKFSLPTFRLWHDLGVSALLTIIVTSGTVWLGVWAVMHDKVDAALGILGTFGLLTKMFWDGYLAKRKDETKPTQPS